MATVHIILKRPDIPRRIIFSRIRLIIALRGQYSHDTKKRIWKGIKTLCSHVSADNHSCSGSCNLVKSEPQPIVAKVKKHVLKKTT